jgi:hypothetical protein
MADKLEVFDPTGNVKSWLDGGRGVNVWENVDLSSPRVGHLIFTPADKGAENAPHWAYRLQREVQNGDDVLFYEKIGVASGFVRGTSFERAVKETSFSATPAGRKAAERAAGILEDAHAQPYNAPIGTVRTAYTVEELKYETPERVEYSDGVSRPLATMFRWCVIEWSCITPSA